MIAVDEALNERMRIDPRSAQVIEMRFFAEMTNEEIASVLGVTDRTVKRDWEDGRLWLYGRMKKREKT